MTSSNPHSTVVVLPTWVGDAVMATPLLEALHEERPGSRIDLLAKPYLRGLLGGAPWLGEVLEFRPDASLLALRSEIRRRRYELALVLPNSLRPALLLWAARVKRRVGYARNGRRPFLTDPLPFPRTRGKTVPFRMVDFYGKLGEAIGVRAPVRPMRLYVEGGAAAAVDRLLDERGIQPDEALLGVNPGAKYGSSKLWPAEHFARAADRVSEETGARVVILAGPGEDALAMEIAAAMRRPAVALPSEQVDLARLKAVIRRLDLLVTNDTGPRHVAAALGVPTITIFGPTHPRWGDTGFERAVDLAIPVDCGPCMRKTCPLGHHRCMVDLPVDRVVGAALELLRRFPPSDLRLAARRA